MLGNGQTERKKAKVHTSTWAEVCTKEVGKKTRNMVMGSKLGLTETDMRASGKINDMVRELIFTQMELEGKQNIKMVPV